MKTLSLLTLLLLACLSPATITFQEATLDKEFKIKINSHAVIQNESIKITFNKVLEDSRCPEGARCAWAGNARVSLTVAKNSDQKTFELDSYEGKTFVEYQGCEIKFIDLSPYPNTNKPAKGDPVVTLLVSKKK
jgi:hypothetical protein